ncbi:gp36 hinge connector of long tail fiber [Acinetobacter phage Ac42]|uniref:hinge connector of long tail fiber protein distal connector n=1 Tax=Acinetobacter phage Ac42 TaxID=762660 RepID=UPI0001EBCE1D|nr:hinge connector of long tail fiber protein distal connector [Acinetobacter phage Ac42]ADI96481.1 gp36 hinge connector of long tail fiber [Acinetobacter phage Ac42]
MADLKTGTTVGGQLVWTQGNFPLFPTGNTLLYKTFKVYTENDKPQAVDNDFVSKANGGSYLKLTSFVEGVKILGAGNLYGGFVPGSGDGTTDVSTNPASVTTNTILQSHWGIGISSYQAQGVTVNIDSRNGDISTKGNIRAAGQMVIRTAAPTAAEHATRKDYVDAQINNVTSNANTRVLRAGDVMTGNLSAPNFVSLNLATLPTHVPQLSQVVVKGTVLDYGTY